jgi:hypothetical protein
MIGAASAQADTPTHAGTQNTTQNTTQAPTDGLHLLQTVWSGGCTVNFAVDSGAASDYRENVLNSLQAIAVTTGLVFNQVGSDDPRAAIRYSVADSLPDQVMGLATSMGDVTLLDESALPNRNDATLDAELRDRIVAHETLHVLGLDHDADVGAGTPDELMSPTVTWAPLEFGAGDLRGMKYLTGINGCQPPAPAAAGGAPAGSAAALAAAVASAPPVVTVDPVLTAAEPEAVIAQPERGNGGGNSGSASQAEDGDGRGSSPSRGCGQSRRSDSSDGTCAPPANTGSHESSHGEDSHGSSQSQQSQSQQSQGEQRPSRQQESPAPQRGHSRD